MNKLFQKSEVILLVIDDIDQTHEKAKRLALLFI